MAGVSQFPLYPDAPARKRKVEDGMELWLLVIGRVASDGPSQPSLLSTPATAHFCGDRGTFRIRR